ncbi:MAG: GTP cyclohydrolase FolE2 [Phycisphaerales bacterium]
MSNNGSGQSVVGGAGVGGVGGGKPVSVMPDVQGTRDSRNVAIDRVGVKGVTYPIRLAQSPRAGGGEQTTVAVMNMYVSLPAEQKGTHMSRFLEALNEQQAGSSPAVTPENIPEITRSIARRLKASRAHFSAEFTYFIKKAAPVTGQTGLMDYKVTFSCDAGPNDGDDVDFVMGVLAPATSLCPCSKEISRFGAHNQRCLIEARVRMAPDKGVLWIEDLAALLEGAASCQVYSVLKRPDEKQVTEEAYENPKFVEDIVRDLALAMENEPRVAWYSIGSENFESIHNHNAYARITRAKAGFVCRRGAADEF